MKKEEIYHEYALLPKEDGTFSDYFKVYMEHPQQDEETLIYACEQFSDYVGFCMDIVVKYKSKKDGKYRQFAFNEHELDYTDYQIHMYGYDIVIDNHTELTEINYPNIERLVAMVDSDMRYDEIFTSLLNGVRFV